MAVPQGGCWHQTPHREGGRRPATAPPQSIAAHQKPGVPERIEPSLPLGGKWQMANAQNPGRKGQVAAPPHREHRQQSSPPGQWLGGIGSRIATWSPIRSAWAANTRGAREGGSLQPQLGTGRDPAPWPDVVPMARPAVGATQRAMPMRGWERNERRHHPLLAPAVNPLCVQSLEPHRSPQHQG